MGKLKAALIALALAAAPMGTAVAAADEADQPVSTSSSEPAGAELSDTNQAGSGLSGVESGTPDSESLQNTDNEGESDEEEQPVEAVPVYRVYNPVNGEHLMASEQHEAAVLEADGWYDEGTSFESDTAGDIHVHRLFNRVSGEHHYTADAAEIAQLKAGDWNDEGEFFPAYSADCENAETVAPVAVYRLYNGKSGIGSHHYTTSKSEHDTLVSQGWRSEGVAFRAVKEGTPKAWPDWATGKIQTINVYRAFNPKSGEHLYTTDGAELADLTLRGWNDEGVGWRSPSSSNAPVKRLYNPVLGDHHYTTDANEAATLVRSYGWKDEGVAFYSSEQKEVAVYRQFNPAATVGAHNFTTSKAEYDANNASNGWRGEGTAWYAKEAGTPKPAPSPKVDCTKEKCVAFTFDDGPTRIYTPMVLDILRKHNIHGTFFTIGQNVERYPELVAREVAEGHAVGSHTWSHPFLTQVTAADITKELTATDAVISKAIGYGTRTNMVPTGMTVSGGQLRTQYMRPPYGDVNDAVHAALKDNRKTSIKWSVDTLDWKHRDAATAIERVREGVHPGSIVLWHDLHPVASQALDTLITELQAQGYHFVTIPELLNGQSIYGRSISSWP